MRESFDPFEYLSYLQSHWKVAAGTCLAAGLLALAISWMLPPRYTATATIFIDAPAGNDPRSATAVSPIYLESLRTYERFAASDSLFLRAVERFELRAMLSSTADSMKKQILKVSKPRDTKLLEIEVTLTDPRKAQAVAQFLAEETVALNQSLSQKTDDEFLKVARANLEAARATFDTAMKLDRTPIETLQLELETLNTLRADLLTEAAAARTEAADLAAQAPNAEHASHLAGTRARIQTIEKELAAVDSQIAGKQTLLTKRQLSQERTEAEQAMSRATYSAAARRLDEVAAAVGIRGERLKIIDPGVVPERPSSPRTLINVFGALLAAFIISLLYLTFGFAYEKRAQSREQVLPAYR
jgi:uncharacterized protein involved in exopolysaccharide biosynthesis